MSRKALPCSETKLAWFLFWSWASPCRQVGVGSTGVGATWTEPQPHTSPIGFRTGADTFLQTIRSCASGIEGFGCGLT